MKARDSPPDVSVETFLFVLETISVIIGLNSHLCFPIIDSQQTPASIYV